MQPDNTPESSAFYQFFAGNRSLTYAFPAAQSLCSTSSSSLREVLEFTEEGRRASAASENHKEAERKRRERINNHLNKLRAILLCNSKTDKASLLAKVVQRVRELNQQTSEINMQFDQTFPSETDEIAVLQNDDGFADGKSVVKASFCCDDRVDLIPDLIEILKSLPLIPLKAEMVTLGGRVRNVIVLSGEKDQATDESVLLLKNALTKLILKSSCNGGGERLKRRRIFDQSGS